MDVFQIEINTRFMGLNERKREEVKNGNISYFSYSVHARKTPIGDKIFKFVCLNNVEMHLQLRVSF